MKRWEVLEWLNNWQLLKKGSAPLSIMKMPAYYALKDNSKQLYCRWFLVGDEVLTPSGTLQKPRVEMLCQWTNATAADFWIQKVL
jgi:hypothetical protein